MAKTKVASTSDISEGKVLKVKTNGQQVLVSKWLHRVLADEALLYFGDYRRYVEELLQSPAGIGISAAPLVGEYLCSLTCLWKFLLKVRSQSCWLALRELHLHP